MPPLFVTSRANHSSHGDNPRALFESTAYRNIQDLLSEGRTFVNLYEAIASYRNEQLTEELQKELTEYLTGYLHALRQWQLQQTAGE